MNNEFERIGEADYIISPLKTRRGAMYLGNQQIKWIQNKKSSKVLKLLSWLGLLKQIDYSFLMKFNQVTKFQFIDFETYRTWQFDFRDDSTIIVLIKNESNDYIRFYEKYVSIQMS